MDFARRMVFGAATAEREDEAGFAAAAEVGRFLSEDGITPTAGRPVEVATIRLDHPKSIAEFRAEMLRIGLPEWMIADNIATATKTGFPYMVVAYYPDEPATWGGDEMVLGYGKVRHGDHEDSVVSVEPLPRMN